MHQKPWGLRSLWKIYPYRIGNNSLRERRDSETNISMHMHQTLSSSGRSQALSISLEAISNYLVVQLFLVSRILIHKLRYGKVL